MRNAPPVDARLDGAAAVRALVVALHVAVALVVAAWLGGVAAAFDVPTGGGVGHVLLTAVAVVVATGVGRRQARSLLPASRRRLRWDGAAWWLVDGSGRPERVARVDAAVDGDDWIWLRMHLHPAAPPCATPSSSSLHREGRVPICGRDVRWALASRRADPPAWHGLRVALQATPTATAARIPTSEEPSR